MTNHPLFRGVLLLSITGCVTKPGVLEGEGGDEVADDTDGAELADCMTHGTNLAGGTDPSDFPIEQCPITCDEGATPPTEDLGLPGR